MQAADTRAAKLGLGLKLAYASGAMVEGMVSALVNTFLLFYVTTVCGMPAALAGAAIAIGLVVDAIADPMIGSMSDNLHSHLGRRLPFMLAALPVIVFSFIGIFSLPDLSNVPAQFVLVALLSIAIRMSVSTFHLPFLSLAAELTDDHAERSRLAAFCWGFAMVGALSGVMIAFTFFFSGPDGIAKRAAYTPFAVTLSSIILLGGCVCMRAVYRNLGRLHSPPVSHTPAGRRLIGELHELVRNRSFRLLFPSAMIFFIAFGVTQALGLHANTFFWHLDSAQMRLVQVAFIGGTLLGAPIAGPIISRIEKRTSVLIGLGGWALLHATPTSLRLLGLLPLEGQPLAVTLATTAALGGALMSMAAIAFMSMMADATDEHEYLFGARREGLFYAGWAFAGKTAGSIGTLLTGLYLSAIAFPVEQTKEAGLNITLPDTMVRELGLLYGPGAGLLSFCGAVFLLQYRLNRATHKTLLAELRLRRQAATPI